LFLSCILIDIQANTSTEDIMSEQTTLTPYAAAKVVNVWLAEKAKEAGVPAKKLPPQMFYTYRAKGYIPSDEEGCFAVEDLQNWFETKYKARTSKKSAKQEVEFDSDGTVGEWA
jgi:hypothetical protein